MGSIQILQPPIPFANNSTATGVFDVKTQKLYTI